jgi:hypothetical protein
MGAAVPSSDLSPGARPAAAQAAMRSVPSLSRVTWSHPENMEFPDWLAAGRRLGVIGRASQWWIGDWLVYGASKFGERYLEASKVTGYDIKSLRNMRYVSSRFEPSLRRDDLNWSHHALLAALDAEEQRYWLGRAAADRLSVEDLRCELRSAARGNYTSTELEPASDMLICPNCGAPVPLKEIRLSKRAASGEAA